jgi:citrate synthase
MAKELGASSDPKWYEIARSLEDAANKIFQAEKPGKRIYANVEFYTAPTLYSLGIPADEFTCMFACGRMAGWTAHILEQLGDNRLIRPQAAYTGPPVQAYVPIESRSSAKPNGATKKAEGAA